MTLEEAAARIPTSSEGFLKVGPGSSVGVPRDQKAALVRRGNELFNRGDYDTAKRIFVTVRYSDGLIRLANRADEAGDVLEALRLYAIAGDTRNVAALCEKSALVIRRWLSEDPPSS